MEQSGATALEQVSTHLIWAYCSCGYAAPIEVAHLLELPNPPETVGDVVRRAKCRQCGTVGVSDFRLVWRCASG
jgi:hypothetical protein